MKAQVKRTFTDRDHSVIDSKYESGVLKLNLIYSNLKMVKLPRIEIRLKISVVAESEWKNNNGKFGC